MVGHSVLDFELPGLPRTNVASSGGRWAQAKERKRWKNLAHWQARGEGLPSAPLHRARLRLTRCSSSEPDFDGLVISFKGVLDGLVQAGVIVDDKPSVIGQPEYRWEKAKRGKGFIRVEVWEAT